MKYADIIKEVNKKVFRPVYFLYGEEPYFIDLVTDHLAENILEPSEREFNQTMIYGRDANMSEMVSTLKCFPMMSNYQVIILKEAQAVDDKSYDLLSSYLANPQPSSILVIAYKKKLGKKVENIFAKHPANVVMFESPKISDDKLPDWVMGYLTEHKITCSPKIAQIISGFLGNDLSKIVNELSKLMINVPAGSTITMDDVEANIGISKKYNVFEFQTAIVNHETTRALEIATYFAANTRDVSIFAIIPILYSFFEKLFIYLQLINSKSPDAVAAEMKIRPFFISNYAKAAKFYNMKRVLDVLKILRSYDLKAKGVDSTSSEGELIREMTYKIIHV